MPTSWQVETVDGDRLDVITDGSFVVIEFGEEGCRRLNQEQAEEFARLFVAACWEASAHAGRLEVAALNSPELMAAVKAARDD